MIVDAEGGPVVLVLEIVKDLGGKSMVVDGVCGGRFHWIWDFRGNGGRIVSGQRGHISGWKGWN